tara:strand:+ start:3127 stop:3810 length:684 start_codon:yes stop_codon:yes gene_type:complete
MNAPVYLLASIVAVLLTSISPAPAEPIVGRAKIIDGDTIQIAGNRIRLHGIDAPEAKQLCRRNGKRHHCGTQATSALAHLVGKRRLLCRQKDRDRYGRIVAICNIETADGTDINAEMVRLGLALAYRRYSIDYVTDEDAAKRANAGLWGGQFVAPWDWRQGKRLQAVNDNVAGKCLVKGNISKRGVRIYHVPGGAYYSRTRIDEQKGERWFCGESDARNAGWRRSKR